MKISKTSISGQLLMYVTIILLYFLLIGIIITVLLLAPRYPSFRKEKATVVDHHLDRDFLSPLADPDQLPPISLDFDQSYESQQRPHDLDEYFPKRKKPFKSSEPDPVHDIDPRSNRNKINNEDNISEDRVPVNGSKILRSLG